VTWFCPKLTILFLAAWFGKSARRIWNRGTRILAICSILSLLWMSPSWAQALPTADVSSQFTPLIDRLSDPNVRLQRQAIESLVKIGAPAIPALVPAIKSDNLTLRLNVVSILSDLGAEAESAVPVLIQALQDNDEQVRLYATLALGNIGIGARAAETELIRSLQDRSSYVRIYASYALRQIGVDIKVTIPALVKALSDSDPQVQANAANALGAMGVDGLVAIPELIKLAEVAVPELNNLLNVPEKYVEFAAVRALGNIAGGFQDLERKLSWPQLNSAIETFTPVLKVLEEHHDIYAEAGIARIRRPLTALQAEQETRWFGRSIAWLLEHKIILGIAAYLTIAPILALSILQIAPLWILKINNALKPYTDFSIPLIGINVPLRYVLFVGWWHYHPRVLDAWVAKYLPIARTQFSQRETVSQRSCYLPIPVVVNGETQPQLAPSNLRETFGKQRNRLLIWGEGGAGKTSLACQIARWAMAESDADRLCDRLMLPVLLEEDFRIVECKSALLEAISGQLQLLIDEPEPLCLELLTKLLRQRRILVIIDRFSELNPTTRESIQPESPDFPINALIVTSRIEEKLGRVNKSTIKPLRLETNKVSSFMEAYLMQRGHRDKITDAEFFAICTRLSQMVGSGQITVLLAKLYAEQAMSQTGNIPATVPGLMLGYLNELNRDITLDRLPDRVVHQVAKLVAWQCLYPTYQPHLAQRSALIQSLLAVGIGDADAILEYLEHRLYAIQPIGTSQQQFRFCLDPLAEYLAALYLVDTYGTDGSQWHSFLKTAATLPPAASGFLLALSDCYATEFTPPATDIVAQELNRLASLLPPVASSVRD
jgi:HEAT repeat protein